MPAEITPDLVRGLWEDMSKHYGSTVLNKHKSDLMKLCGWALDLMGIQDQKQFLERYSNAILDSIYIPFQIGVASRQWSLWDQIVICVHEHEHVRQFQKAGALAFAANYLGSDTERAVYEAEAYRGHLEMNWWQFRQIPDTMQLARKLLGYGCTMTEVHFVDEFLKMSADAIREGAVINETSSFAIHWMRG